MSNMNQMVMFPSLEDLKRQMDAQKNENRKKRRRWENAFQKWCNEQGMDGTVSYGSCGYGSMCDWCIDNSYGRPCVRALNEMCRVKGLLVDYDRTDFESIWNGDVRGECNVDDD